MNTDKEYQIDELRRFNAEHSKGRAFFDNLPDFLMRWGDASKADLLTQLDWIEKGNYGAGACFALQRVVGGLTSRTNDTMRVGQFFLACLYGETFTRWKKLPQAMQEHITLAVNEWLKGEKNYAQKLIA